MEEKEIEQETYEWILSLPKTDLHCHLGGSLRLESLIDFAKENSVSLPTTDPEKLKKYVIIEKPEKVEDYLKRFELTEAVLRSESALERATRELCEDAANENVKLLEVRFGPTNYKTKKLTLPKIIESVLSGLKEGEKKHNIKTGLIICGIRTDKEATREAAEIAVNYQDSGVVGFDLAGKEKGARPKDFQEIFKILFDNFMPITVHAGETYKAKSVAEAINYLNAARIGHGTSIRENPRLMGYVNKMRVGIEVCPTSNIMTRTVASYQSHPIRTYFKQGLRVSINTDNRLMCNTTVTKELYLLVRELNFTKNEIKQVVKNGFKSAFITSNKMKKFLDDVDENFEKLK